MGREEEEGEGKGRRWSRCGRARSLTWKRSRTGQVQGMRPLWTSLSSSPTWYKLLAVHGVWSSYSFLFHFLLPPLPPLSPFPLYPPLSSHRRACANPPLSTKRRPFPSPSATSPLPWARETRSSGSAARPPPLPTSRYVLTFRAIFFIASPISPACGILCGRTYPVCEFFFHSVCRFLPSRWETIFSGWGPGINPFQPSHSPPPPSNPPCEDSLLCRIPLLALGLVSRRGTRGSREPHDPE